MYKFGTAESTGTVNPPWHSMGIPGFGSRCCYQIRTRVDSNRQRIVVIPCGFAAALRPFQRGREAFMPLKYNGPVRSSNSGHVWREFGMRILAVGSPEDVSTGLPLGQVSLVNTRF